MEDPIEQVRREIRERAQRTAQRQNDTHPRDYRCIHGGEPLRCVACESTRERGKPTAYVERR